jgi:aldose 1-epimerase
MEAVDLLPTGRLVDLDDGPADMCDPTPLSELNLDDVFWGMEPNEPQVIYYDSISKKVTLAASDFFTHACIFTPPQYPFFCVENQSCSTDAHNLYAQGLEKEAHLVILEPEESLSAWIEITVSDQ